jgi:hypothetical protein
MRDQLQLPPPIRLLAIVAVLVIGVTIVALIAGRDQEGPETAQEGAEAEITSTIQPAPTEAKEAAEEPASEVDSDAEPAPTEAPTPEEAPPSNDMDEFVSITEFFTLMVPAGWVSEETMPGAAFAMANNEGALARSRDNSPVEPGDFVINVGFLPYRLPTMPLPMSFCNRSCPYFAMRVMSC